MEWNWLSGNNNYNSNNMTPFFLSESTGDSEEVKSDVHEKDEAAMDEQEAGVLFGFSDDQDDDDDAQSCSYEHLSYMINTGNMGQDQSQSRLISYDDHGDDDEVDDDDKNMKNDQSKSKVMGSSKQQWRSNCVHDPSNQRESDRKFWEACLTS